MTAAQPVDTPDPASARTVEPTEPTEPSRFTAYARGCEPEPAGVTDRFLALVERVLVPELNRVSRRRSRPE